MWPPLVTAFNLLDGFHATFILAGSTHILIWEGLLAMPPLIAPLSTREIQASHGHPADEPVGNLQVYWLRVAASFQTPVGLLEAAGLAGLLSPTQRAVVLSMLALHHFFDGIAIHGGQVSKQTLPVTGTNPRNSTWHAENCPLFWPKTLLCDLSLAVQRRVSSCRILCPDCFLAGAAASPWKRLYKRAAAPIGSSCPRGYCCHLWGPGGDPLVNHRWPSGYGRC